MLLDRLVNLELLNDIVLIKKYTEKQRIDLKKKINISEIFLFLAILSLFVSFIDTRIAMLLFISLLLVSLVLFILAISEISKNLEEIVTYFPLAVNISRQFSEYPSDVIIRRLGEANISFLSNVFKFIDIHGDIELALKKIKHVISYFKPLEEFILILQLKDKTGININKSLEFLANTQFEFNSKMKELNDTINGSLSILKIIFYVVFFISIIVIVLMKKFIMFSSEKITPRPFLVKLSFAIGIYLVFVVFLVVRLLV